MRFGILGQLACILCLASPIHAEIYSLYTKNFPGVPQSSTVIPPTTLGVNLSIPGILGLPGPLSQPAAPSGFVTTRLNGSGTVDMNLDSTNSGTAYVSANFYSNGVSYSQSGTILGVFPYSISLEVANIALLLNNLSINITQGNFSTGFSLNNDTLVLGHLSVALSIPSLNLNYQYSTNNYFISLSGLTGFGSADDDNGGFDNGGGSGRTHNGAPGVTGLNPNDTHGTEFNLYIDGQTSVLQVSVGSSTVPVIIGFTSNIHTSVLPEASSSLLAGTGVVLAGSVLLVRRKRSS